MIVSELGPTNAKSVKTLGEPGRRAEDNDEKPLDKERGTKFRGMAARTSYLAQGRMDTQYTVKELSRAMAAPAEADWEKLKRPGRYLAGKPRVVTSYPWQERVGMVTGYSDSD